MSLVSSILIFLGMMAILIIATMLPVSINLYFMSFKLEKHPKILEMLEDLVYTICREESIGVFHEDFKVMNAGAEKGHEALGRYTYTTNKEFQETINASRMRVEALESEYNEPYERVCEIVGFKNNKKKSDFVLPRITMCNSLRDVGLTSYYSTFFHEIGHHFAVKDLGSNHSETDADFYSRKIVRERLPLFVQLIYTFHYNYRLNEKMLKNKERMLAYFGYLRYLLTKEVNYGS